MSQWQPDDDDSDYEDEDQTARPDPGVTLAVVSLNGLGVTTSDLQKMKREVIEEWERAWDGTPPFPLVVLPPGCVFQLISD